VLDFRKRIFPDRSLTPPFTLLFALIGRTHRLPSESVGMIDVLLCALRALLMDQIKIAESCLFMCIQFEQDSGGSELVGGGNGVVASIKNIPRTANSSLLS
jgi:hypothetical protein